ncbi:MAG: hypothetical protein ABI832_23200, partial [bacterium]
MTKNQGLIFYVLIGYGRKPTPPVAKHEAALRQVDNLRSAIPVDSLRTIKFIWDYARQVRQLDDLPNLRDVLQKLLALKAGKVIVDNLARFFSRCPLADRIYLLNELELFGEHLFEVRSAMTLRAMDADQKHKLLVHPEKLIQWAAAGARTRRPSDARRRATEKASDASLIARREAA